MTFFLQGLTLGLAYVAPIGMQNLFVINAALNSTRRRALLTACIVIFFDISLSLACFFGVGRLLQLFPALQLVILGIGSLIVLYIGLCLIRSRQETAAELKPLSVRKTISEACIVTWFNPQAILDGTMLLGAFQVTLSWAESSPFISGVMLASFLWFTGLTLVISCFRSRFSARVLRGINIVCGTVIIGYGIQLLLHFGQMIGLV